MRTVSWGSSMMARFDADEHGVARRPEAVRDPPLRLAGDPLASPRRVAMRPSTVCAYLSTTYGRHDGAAGRPRRGATLTASPIGSPSSGTPAGATCPSRASLAWRYSAFRMCGDV